MQDPEQLLTAVCRRLEQQHGFDVASADARMLAEMVIYGDGGCFLEQARARSAIFSETFGLTQRRQRRGTHAGRDGGLRQCRLLPGAGCMIMALYNPFLNQS